MSMTTTALFGLGVGLLASAICAAAAQAMAPSEGQPPSAVMFMEHSQARAIDCKGADLTVVGNDNTLEVSGCATITIPGSRNRIWAKLLESSSISVSGDANRVSWRPAPGASPPVSSSGSNNEINPQFSARDSISRPFSPAPRPDGAAGR